MSCILSLLASLAAIYYGTARERVNGMACAKAVQSANIHRMFVDKSQVTKWSFVTTQG